MVDDCPQLLDVLNEVLTAHGFEVIQALGAERAFEALEAHHPEIIVCDVMMPGIDGFKFNEEVKQHPEWFDIPFIFLSALSQPEDIRLGKEAGCDDYITKPFDPLDLVSVLRGKLHAAQQRRRRSSDKLDQYRKRVIYTLSHEFRTPLVAINTGTELLLDQQTNLDRVNFQRLLESVHRGGIRLQRLVEDFMTLQQIDSGAAAATAERLRRKHLLWQVAQRAIENFRDQMNDPRLSVETVQQLKDDSQAEVAAEVCEIQIINALQRLLSNAHKFGGPGNLITVGVRGDDISSSIFVRDRGPGLAPEVAAEACKLFTQIDREKNEQQGCGLGLTIAASYVGLNRGELHFERPEDGTGLLVEMRFRHVV